MSYEDPLVMYRTDYFVCTQQIDQGPDFRKAVYNAWLKEMTLITPADEDFDDYIPRIPDDNAFNVRVILPNTGDQALRTIHFDDYKIWIKNPNDALIKFKNIDVSARLCTIDSTPKQISALKKIQGLDNIDYSCCWSYNSLQTENIICPDNKIRC